MNIHEHQAKEILKSFGIPVPRGRIAVTAAQAERSVSKLGVPCIIKAQIYAGGRGKAGGVKIIQNPPHAREVAKDLLGKRLVTTQTGAGGLTVKRVLVEEVIEVDREIYLSITLNRHTSRYCVIASAEGGMDIEEVAQKSPGKIHTFDIDPFIGLRPYHACKIAQALGLRGGLIEECIKLIQNLYALVLEKDCSLVEVNPLVLSKAGVLIAMDCKINFDDNALFRHPEYEEMVDFSQMDPLEINARKYDLSYIKLAGNIGCMVNGAGLAMATLDVLEEFGGEPANFLDVGGGANREKVAEAFRIILDDRDVKGIFVNIFAGIARCDIIAQGIIDTVSKINCTLPIVVRMEGSHLQEGKRFLSQSRLHVETVEGLGEGAARIIKRMSENSRSVAN